MCKQKQLLEICYWQSTEFTISIARQLDTVVFFLQNPYQFSIHFVILTRQVEHCWRRLYSA